MDFSLKRFRAICFGVMLLLGLNLSIYQSVISDISDTFGFEGVFAGFLIALYFLGALVIPAVGGSLGDRIGKKPALLAAAVVMLTGVVVVTQARHVVVLGLGIFLKGGGSCTLEGLLSAKITDENPKSAEKMISYSQLFFCIGAVAGPLLALAVRFLGGAWHTSLYVVAFLLIIVFAALWQIPGDRQSIQKQNDVCPANRFVLFKDIRFILFFVSMLLYVGAEEGVAFFVMDYFADMNAPSLGEISLSLFWGAMIFGRWIAGKLYRHAGKIMVLSLSLAAASSFFLRFVEPPMISVFLFFALGFGMAAVWPLLMAACTRTFHNTTGTAGGLMMTGGALGGMLMPMLIDALAERGSIRDTLFVTTAAMLISMLLHICLQRMKDHSKTV